MSDSRKRLIEEIASIGKPVDILSVNLENHAPKMLRAWADAIESGEVTVTKAVMTVELDVDPDLKNINLILAQNAK